MLLTYDPANIACAQAVASAGRTSAATAILGTNQACAQSQNTSTPREIRRLLHLPPTADTPPGHRQHRRAGCRRDPQATMELPSRSGISVTINIYAHMLPGPRQDAAAAIDELAGA